MDDRGQPTPEEIRAVRLAAGMIKAEFAERMRTYWKNVHDWETGATKMPPIAFAYLLEKEAVGIVIRFLPQIVEWSKKLQDKDA